MALITYVTRPCDTHPDTPAADGYLFISRTYFASSKDDQTTVRVGRMLSRTVESEQDIKVPQHSLGASHAPLPPISSYATFPWAASVGYANPVQLDTVFDDRYFMACNELNLLNTLLLAYPDAATLPQAQEGLVI